MSASVPSRRPRGRPRARRFARCAPIARRQALDLDGLIGERYCIEGPEDLTSAEASRLIDDLQQAPADATA